MSFLTEQKIQLQAEYGTLTQLHLHTCKKLGKFSPPPLRINQIIEALLNIDALEAEWVEWMLMNNPFLFPEETQLQ